MDSLYQKVALAVAAQALLERATKVSVTALRSTRSPAPAVSGIYGWWFDKPPGEAPTDGCIECDGARLMYVGIAGGRSGSRRTLRSRLRNHVYGPSRFSTLRRTLAVLLTSELDLAFDRSPSRKLVLVGDGEERLSGWMERHMRVSWQVHEKPDDLEAQLLSCGPPLPLNIQGSRHPFTSTLRLLRRG